MKTANSIEAIGGHPFLLAGLLLVVASGTGMKSCDFDVQCGDVLALDHGQYRLNGDLVCAATSLSQRDAVTITGNNVHFNLKGHTIRQADTPAGHRLRHGISVRGANAHINGGSVIDFDCPNTNNPDCAGVRLFEAPGAQINGMSLHNNTIGIFSFRFDGNADGAGIHGNDITGNLRLGIGLFGTAEGAKVTGNDLSNTRGFVGSELQVPIGYASSSDGVSVTGNVANNCEGSGIVLFGSDFFPAAQRNTIRDNTTLDNGLSGIATFGTEAAFRPRDNLIQSNTSFGNGVNDLVEAITGPLFPADCLNTWQDNDFDVAAQDCIE
jgi:hypothetical protein